MATTFNFERAFSRNLGLLSEEEQALLSTKKVAIAGLGGVGGVHFLTLVRMGMQHFHLSDFDIFELENFNRQIGARSDTIGRPKLEVLVEEGTKINPNIQVNFFPAGVSANNLDEFLQGVDIYIDGLDFFAFSARMDLFKALEVKKIPGVTVGPIGLGAAHINFIPGSMCFDEYFGFSSCNDDVEKGVRFLLGLVPSLAHVEQVVESERLDLSKKKGPSLMAACQLCSGVAGAEVMKILLSRGSTFSAPVVHYYNLYRNTVIRKKIYLGYKNPLQVIKYKIAIQKYKQTLGY